MAGVGSGGGAAWPRLPDVDANGSPPFIRRGRVDPSRAVGRGREGGASAGLGGAGPCRLVAESAGVPREAEMAAGMSLGAEEGLLKNESLSEVGEDAAASVNVTEAISEEEQEELRRELAKVEEEILTLTQVLAAKEKHLADIKRKLGINSLQELKQNLSKGWQDVTSTNAYRRTTETLSQAGQKASAAFSSVGTAITKKFEDVKNSPTFKSFEEKVESLKYKVGGTKPPAGDFEEVLNSTANASATETTIQQIEEENQ